MTTEQTIYNTAIRDGMPSGVASFMVYQAQHETGNFTHRFFTVGKNAFGYSYNKNSKWQLDKGGPKADNGIPIAQYSSVENSVHELTDWIKRRQAEGVFPADLKTIRTTDEYTALLKKGNYFGDTLQNYAAGLMRYAATTVKRFTQKVVSTPARFFVIAALVLVAAYGIFIYQNRKKITV